MATTIGDAVSKSLDESIQKASETCRKSEPRQVITAAEWEASQHRRAVDDLLKLANVPARHLRTAMKTPPHEAWDGKFATVSARLGNECLFAFVGNRGVGKTQMAVAAIIQTCEEGRSARYIVCEDLFLRLEEARNGDGATSQRKVLAEYEKVGLLVIDEIHDRKGSQYEDRILTRLIDQRYLDLKDTILISNETPEEFSAAIGTSASERLRETGGVVRFEWGSFRQ
jgi:DNA replication protein DnaC